MVTQSHRIFFDTSVYIAALLSPQGSSGELVRLAEAGAIRIVVSERVVVEADRVLARRFPDLIEGSHRLWRSISPEIAPAPSSRLLPAFSEKLQPGDASLLCSAQMVKVSAFVTWNTRDFMKPGVANLVSFPIVIPGECLKLFRKWIEPLLD